MRIVWLAIAAIMTTFGWLAVYLTGNANPPAGLEGQTYVMFWSLAALFGLAGACSLAMAFAEEA